jgi:hypothetical protein
MKPSAPSHAARRVLVFSGHMVDTPRRAQPRFPPAAVPQAAADIARVLDELKVGPGDYGLTQGSSGGDLLFAQACQQRGVHLRLMQAVPEPRFIEESLLPSADGEQWRQRYLAVKARLAMPPDVLPDALPGVSPEAQPGTSSGAIAASGVYVRCNQWLLDTAHGLVEKGKADSLHFICLWDGAGGDGPGGTAHMVQEVRRRHGQVHHIKPRL